MFKMKTLILAFALLCFGCHDHGDHDHDHDNNGHDPNDGHHDNDDDADAGDVSIDIPTDLEITEAATDYCDCVFLNCHDDYHDKWGADEGVARNGCLVEASQIAQTGTGEGDHLTCRQTFCADAETDETQCNAALGNSVCIP